jgi:hypothetical protein
METPDWRIPHEDMAAIEEAVRMGAEIFSG